MAADVVSQESRSVLGVRIAVTERPAAAAAVIAAAQKRQPFGVSALAVHGVMEAVFDAELQYRLNELELVVADGQPVRWALNWIHKTQLSQRVAGPDLMDDICALAAKEELPIFLYGSTLETLEKLEHRLTAKHTGLLIAGKQASRFRSSTEEEQAADTDGILASGAQIVFVGLGCPRQEIWTYEMRERLSLPVLAVGAAFDFHAGNAQRAPEWMQRSGLEWLYRLGKEPRRLWKRYVLLNPVYLGLAILQAFRLAEISVTRARQPRVHVRPG